MSKKPERTTYWVSPSGDDWKVKLEGASRSVGVFEDKADAIARAKQLAQQAPLGQIIVQSQHGQIQFENTYGKDPRRTKG